MGGGLIQLVSNGVGQDSPLIGNPQITYFKIVYRRHTNFAKEAKQQFFTTSVDFGKIINCTLTRDGDLVQEMYVEISLPTPTNSYVWTYGIGNVLLKKVELEIGGQLIDRHYNNWLDIWSELTVPASKHLGYDNMVGNLAYGDIPQKLYVPLVFWFNRCPGLALPLVALEYHQVRIHIEINENKFLLFKSGSPSTYSTTDYSGSLDMKLYADYIYLDDDERRYFTSMPIEYLIEQVQFNGDEYINSNISSYQTNLNFKNPVKEINWVHISSNSSATADAHYNPYFDYSLTGMGSNDSFSTARITINGVDRFRERYSDYFLLVQNYQTRNNIPRYSDSPYRQYIHTYSFALDADKHQPSGYCNFSRLNEANIIMTYPSSGSRSDMTLKIYAVSYNVLRIYKGMGGLLLD